MIQELNRKFDKKLFSVEAISSKGEIFTYDDGKKMRIRLLCDDDIISLSKSLLDDPLVNEYFERNKRRHPLWKSEAEYNAYIKDELGGPVFDKVKNAIRIMLDSLEGKKVYSIDDKYISEMEAEIKFLKEKKKENVLDDDTFNAQMAGKSQILCLCNGLKNFANSLNIKMDFVFFENNSI